MNLKGFLVSALSSALDLGIGTPEDILTHVGPEVLAEHLPRPLWARLLTACVGAPKVDAQLVVETIGLPNLCEHVPTNLMWSCLADIGARSLRDSSDAPIELPVKTSPPTPPPRGKPLTAPPPDVIVRDPSPAPPPAAMGPTIPSLAVQALAEVVAELEADERGAITTPPSRVRTPTNQRFRQGGAGTGIGRLATSSAVRRPQAQASSIATAADPTRARRPGSDDEGETQVGPREDWRTALAVEDEQLVEWSASEEVVVTTDDDKR